MKLRLHTITLPLILLAASCASAMTGNLDFTSFQGKTQEEIISETKTEQTIQGVKQQDNRLKVLFLPLYGVKKPTFALASSGDLENFGIVIVAGDSDQLREISKPLVAAGMKAYTSPKGAIYIKQTDPAANKLSDAVTLTVWSNPLMFSNFEAFGNISSIQADLLSDDSIKSDITLQSALGTKQPVILAVSPGEPAQSDWMGHSKPYRRQVMWPFGQFALHNGFKDAFDVAIDEGKENAESNPTTWELGDIEERMDTVYLRGIDLASIKTVRIETGDDTPGTPRRKAIVFEI